MTLPRKELFEIPEGVIYLDGNSLGLLPKGTEAKVAKVLSEEWGQQLIRAWNTAGWMDLPRKAGDRIGGIIGALEGSVATGDTLSIKVFQALAAALKMRPERKVILSDAGNFPTDLYMAQGLADLIGGYEIRTPAHEDVASQITEDVAVVMLTHVDYRTGQMYDMADITRRAHAAGAVMLWDLAHSAGAVPVDMAGCNAEFAAGCSYKYLNSGPGGPAFIYVAPRHAETVRPALSGWLGHESPFAFDLDYRPGAGIERMRVGTPPVLQLAALDAALDVWDGVEIADLRARSIELCEAFIAGVEATCPTLELATPRDASMRGSQVSFRHPEGYAIMQALIARGVIGDFRAPDILRFGFTPLYIGLSEVEGAVKILAEIMATAEWDRPEFKKRARVT